MRTTIRLDEHLVREAKKLATETNRSLTAVIEEALREVLARRRATSSRPPVVLPTFGEGGLRPGVSLDDTAALIDQMDGR